MLQASEQARALDVTNVRAWNNAGIALAGLKSYAEALEAFEQTLTLDPTESWYWGNKARVLTHLRRYEEGLEAIDKALTLAPNDPHLWGGEDPDPTANAALPADVAGDGPHLHLAVHAT